MTKIICIKHTATREFLGSRRTVFSARGNLTKGLRAFLSGLLIVSMLSACGGSGSSATMSPPVATPNPPPPTGTPSSDYNQVAGQVTAPAGVDAASLTIVALGSEQPVSASGEYSTVVRADAVSLVIAAQDVLPFPLATIILPEASSGSSASDIDLTTTAITLVFLSPFTLTQEPDDAAAMLDLIALDPTLPDLVSSIQEVFFLADAFEDQRFVDAYNATLESVLGRIASEVSQPVISKTTRSPSTYAYLRLPKRLSAPIESSRPLSARVLSEPPLEIDIQYTGLEIEEVGDSYRLSPTTSGVNSVDWFVEFAEIDIETIRFEHEFDPAVANSFFVYDRVGALDEPLGIELAAGNGILRWLNFVSTAIAEVADEIRGFASPSGLLIEQDRDALYIVRFFSGGTAGDDDELSFVLDTLPNGTINHRRARILNHLVSATDLLGIALDYLPGVEETALTDCMQSALLTVYRQSSASIELTGSPISEVLTARDLAIDIFDDAAQCLIRRGVISAATGATLIGELWDAIGAPLQLAGKLGQVSERYVFLFNFATPLETMIVQVGNPITQDLEPPTIPNGLAATGTSPTEILVEWVASTDNDDVAEYRVYRDGLLIVASQSSLFRDSQLSAGSTYCYQFEAVDFAGNVSGRSSPPVCGTTLMEEDTTPPTVPVGVTLTVVSSSRIDIDWMDSTDNVGVGGYNVFRYQNPLATVEVSSYSDTTVNGEEEYCYAVSAFDWLGNESERSSLTCTTGVDQQDAAEGWLVFESGDPGVPNDGQFVEGEPCPSVSCGYREYRPLDRIRLAPGASPITLSVYEARFNFFLRYRLEGYPPYCTASYSAPLGSQVESPPYDGVEGKFIVVDAAAFAELFEIARSRDSDCMSATPDAGYLSRIDLSNAGIPMDGAYLGFGVEAFPEDGLPPIPQVEGWLSFEEGEAGVPDDGILVQGQSACLGCPPQHTIIEEFPIGISDGMTLSIYGTEGEAIDDIAIRYSGFPAVCEFRIPIGGLLPNAPTIRGIRGTYLSIARSQLQPSTQIVAISNPQECGDVTPADAYFAVFELSGALDLVDGAFIGIGQNVFPEG